MAAFTSAAVLAAGVGLLIGGISVIAQSGRPLPAGAAFVSFGSITGGATCIALLIVVISHG